jgi:hypothetical protein
MIKHLVGFNLDADREQLPYYTIETIDFLDRYIPKYGTLDNPYHYIDPVDNLLKDSGSVSSGFPQQDLCYASTSP